MSKDEPIFISSSEEFFNIKNNTRISYICRKCNKKVVIVKKYGRNYHSTLLCSSCIRKQNSIKKYGVECWTQTKEFRQKAEATMISRYGAKCTSQSKILKEKCIKTNKEKYGTEWYISSNKSKELRKSIFQEKYGVSNYVETEEFKDKARKSKIEKYGNVSHINKYFYDNTYFDSGWELKFYIYCKDHNIAIQKSKIYFSYIFNNKKHYYFPDFILPCGIIEIKGNQFLKDNNSWYNSLNETDNDRQYYRYKCALENNVTILTGKELKPILNWFNHKYNKNYLGRYRIHNENNLV